MADVTLSNSTFQYIILGIVLLVVLNIATLIVVFATGVGKRVVQRIKQRWKYKHGKHVNVIFLRNNHVSQELFLPKEDDGAFLIDGKRYVVNPLATFLHDGIPTQVNHEGIAEPYNIFDDKDVEKMSTAELESIIMNNQIDGVAALLKKLFIWFLILVLVCIIVAGFASYYGFKLHDYIIAKELLKNSIVSAQIAAEQAMNNVTMVMPR